MAFCTECGATIDDGERFCTNCGAPVGEAKQSASQPTQPAAADSPTQPIAATQAPAAAAVPAAMPAQPPAASQPTQPAKDEGSGLNTSAIVAIVIAAVVVTAVAVGLIVAFATGAFGGGSTSESSSVQIERSGSSAAAATSSSASSASSAASSSSASSSASASSGTATITVENPRTGQMVTEDIRLNSNGGVIPDITSRQYTRAEIEAMGLTDAELYIARNEIVARTGYRFQNDANRNFFLTYCPWYNPVNSSYNLEGVGAVNAGVIAEIERDHGSWYLEIK